MQIKQEIPAFKPITIQLNTREEADAMWGIVETVHTTFDKDSPERDLAIRLSNWFGKTAKL